MRRLLGLAAQDATVDSLLTGRENLVMIGELHHLGRRTAKARADELLDQFALEEAGGRLAKTYSGGMRRRLDLAATLVARPEILFLDEPTTGLDPRARVELWGVLETLVDEGATILLTTQYLDEADRLADDIVVIDHGRVIARGDARSLKSQVGGAQLFATVVDPSQLGIVARARGPHHGHGAGGGRGGAHGAGAERGRPARRLAPRRRPRRRGDRGRRHRPAPADARRRVPHPHRRADRGEGAARRCRDEHPHPAGRRARAATSSATPGWSRGAGCCTCGASPRRWPT